jgi:hypothetical protein
MNCWILIVILLDWFCMVTENWSAIWARRTASSFRLPSFAKTSQRTRWFTPWFIQIHSQCRKLLEDKFHHDESHKIIATPATNPHATAAREKWRLNCFLSFRRSYQDLSLLIGISTIGQKFSPDNTISTEVQDFIWTHPPIPWTRKSCEINIFLQDLMTWKHSVVSLFETSHWWSCLWHEMKTSQKIIKGCLLVCLVFGVAYVFRFVHKVCTGVARMPGTQDAWKERIGDI